MKDYTLSEIKAHCKARVAKYQNPCKGCEMEVVCKSTLPLGWEIEPRDMIELPCKEHRVTAYCDVWDVYFRDKRYGFVAHDCRGTEAAADAFLEHLKGEKE